MDLHSSCSTLQRGPRTMMRCSNWCGTVITCSPTTSVIKLRRSSTRSEWICNQVKRSQFIKSAYTDRNTEYSSNLVFQLLIYQNKWILWSELEVPTTAPTCIKTESLKSYIAKLYISSIMFSVVNFKSAEGSSRLVWHTCKQLPASCILGIKDLLCIEMV